MSANDASLLTKANDWVAEGRKVALATVIETWGSAPQPVGSQLVIDGDGNFEGSVSGGCVEGAVVTEALEDHGEQLVRLIAERDEIALARERYSFLKDRLARHALPAEVTDPQILRKAK